VNPWRRWEFNPQPPGCKPSALAIELHPQISLVRRPGLEPGSFGLRVRHPAVELATHGAGDRHRTGDIEFGRLALCHLSYTRDSGEPCGARTRYHRLEGPGARRFALRFLNGAASKPRTRNPNAGGVVLFPLSSVCPALRFCRRLSEGQSNPRVRTRAARLAERQQK
jgi:hypothetical protein